MATLKYSTNGSTWTTATVTGTGSVTWTTSNIHSVAYSNGVWAAGNNQSQVAVSNTLGSFGIPQFPDNVNTGTTWTTVTSNFGNTSIFSIAYGNGLWIAGGYYAQMRTSTNGSTWTTVTSNFGPSTRIFSIAYGNSLWVAAGGSGTIRTSTNGSAWTTVTSNLQFNIWSMAYGNGLWVAVGQLSQIRTSTNGSTWTTVTSNFGATVINSIAYGNNLWVAGGVAGQLRTSPQLYNHSINDIIAK
jgi:hypothetical protein